MATDDSNKYSWLNSRKSTPVDPNLLFRELTDEKAKEPEVTPVDLSLDDEIQREKLNIFTQASRHRDRLLSFYIYFTLINAGFVLVYISLQGWARTTHGNENLSLIPENALYLLITGMFGQFIGLLTIVTKSVWKYNDFFRYGENRVKSGK